MAFRPLKIAQTLARSPLLSAPRNSDSPGKVSSSSLSLHIHSLLKITISDNDRSLFLKFVRLFTEIEDRGASRDELALVMSRLQIRNTNDLMIKKAANPGLLVDFKSAKNELQFLIRDKFLTCGPAECQQRYIVARAGLKLIAPFVDLVQDLSVLGRLSCSLDAKHAWINLFAEELADPNSFMRQSIAFAVKPGYDSRFEISPGVALKDSNAGNGSSSPGSAAAPKTMTANQRGVPALTINSSGSRIARRLVQRRPSHSTPVSS